MQEQADQTNFEEFIRVVVRKKPQLYSKQKYPDDQVVINQRDNLISINYEEDQQKQSTDFYFDTIFDEQSTQKQIFNNSISPLVISLFQGVNSYILAYGQTGSGKTYTLFGKQYRVVLEEQGIVYRIGDQIFRRIRNINSSNEEQKDNDEQYKVYMSLYTIYFDKVYDILGDNHEKKVRQSRQTNSFYIDNLTKIQIKDEQDFDLVLKSGIEKNRIHQTWTGIASTRSFFFVEIQVQNINKTLGKEQTTFLRIVKFTGFKSYSERKIISTRTRELESKILPPFYDVINALIEQKSNIIILYRGSILTKMLKQGLGQDSRTLMILNLGNPYLTLQLNIKYFLQKDPQQDHQDLLFQLQLAEKVQEIRNKIYSVKKNDII